MYSAIKFRGKRIDNGEWAYGNYFHNFRKGESHSIIDFEHNEWSEVLPETVGQYTGKNDDNGKEIYNGDVLEWKLTHDPLRTIESPIEWFNFAWRLRRLWLLTEVCSTVVIGNVHDERIEEIKDKQ